MKKIAYVRSSSIYDDSRPVKEILALEKAGYFVYVIGWARHGDEDDKCAALFANKNITCIFYPRRIVGGIGLKNITSLLGFIKWTRNIFKKHIHEINAVHMCDLDSAIGVYRIAQKNNIYCIYDIYDYYIDSHTIPVLLRGIIEKMEISVINYSDFTIICTEERKEQLKKAHSRKVVVIHNSPQIDKICCINKLEYDYVYCGSMYSMRLLKEIAIAYPEHSEIKMLFAGFGDLSDIFEDISNKYGNIDYVGNIPYSEVLNIESKAKVLSAIYEPIIRNHRLCAPNKFYEALALGKPLIVCRGTGIDYIVEENNIGLVINYSADEFYLALNKLINDPILCDEMGKRARNLYDSNYRWDIMETRLLKNYSDIFISKL